MAQNTLPRYVNDVDSDFAAITANATAETILTAPAGGLRLANLAFTTDDSAAVTANIFVEESAIGTFQIASIEVPAESGTIKTAPSIDGLNATDSPWLSEDAHGNRFLDIKAGDILKVEAEGLTTASSRKLNVIANTRTLAADS